MPFALLGTDSVAQNSVIFPPDLHHHKLKTGLKSSQGYFLSFLVVTVVSSVPCTCVSAVKRR